MKDRKPLDPLIPLDQLKTVVTGLVAVGKSEVETMESDRPKKRKRAGSQPP